VAAEAEARIASEQAKLGQAQKLYEVKGQSKCASGLTYSANGALTLSIHRAYSVGR
jgi:hypothetical protein